MQRSEEGHRTSTVVPERPLIRETAESGDSLIGIVGLRWCECTKALKGKVIVKVCSPFVLVHCKLLFLGIIWFKCDRVKVYYN